MPKTKKPLTKADIDGPNPITKAFKKYDITVDSLTKKLKEELDAEDKTEFYDKGGVFTGKKVSPSWATRQKARQDAHKLRGDYPVEKVEHTVTLEDQLRAIHDKREKEA